MNRRVRKRGQRVRSGAQRGRRTKPRGRTAPLTPERVAEALAGRGRPLLSATAILRGLGLGRDAIRALRSILRSLERDGRIERIEGRYRLRRPDGLVEGSFTPTSSGHLRSGCVTEESGVVWRVGDAAEAQAGDRVLLQPTGDPSRCRGEILDVLQGRRESWVGIFHRSGNRGWITPYRDDDDWLVEVARADAGAAREGDVVFVTRARRRPRREKGGGSGSRRARGRAPERQLAGEVVEVLGRPGEPEADFRAVAWKRRLPLHFPADVLAAAEALRGALDPAEAARRVDLRQRAFVTIDPPDARDYDDAIHVEATGRGATQLWVAVADVSHYVAEGSPCDAEALRRGNSVYFPDRAIPMLPERLSSDLCSLRPGVERPVLVVELSVNAAGEVTRRNFYPAVIRSRARLVYGDAAAVMEGGGDGGLAPEIAEQLRLLDRVARALRKRRFAAGSIDFELPSAEIVFDGDRHPIGVVAAPRSAAHRAVEEAMLAANRAVAELLERSGTPALYRNHEPPTPRDVAALRELFERFGLLAEPVRGAAGRRRSSQAAIGEGPMLAPGRIADALGRVAGRPEERLVHQVVLRCMRQARYAAGNRGHFALAFRHYTHFTSPIRRYADLVVHRALIEILEERRPEARRGDAAFRRRGERMRSIAGRVSWRERVAMEAEREVVDLQKCACMRRHVGKVFAATVTGIAPFGLWLTLDEYFVDGLVHVSSLPHSVEFDERGYALCARRSGERFQLGDRFDVRLESVDQLDAYINFKIVSRRNA